ncbi:MAG: FAD-dependent oxidoreductase, partial [Deltaproteobacteria bacterium]
LAWSEDERQTLSRSPETRWLLDPFPPGVHAKPEGGSDSTMLLLLWTSDTKRVEPSFPLDIDPRYPEITLRGVSTMIPGMKRYLARGPKPLVDGGYYTKTEENRPLLGPLPVEGAFVMGALSGFGIMAGCAAGELLAAHVMGEPLPHYAPAFLLERYQDPEYLELLKHWPATGQL